MSNQAQTEFGTAAANIAGNIDALLPQLAERGAEIAVVGNAIHVKVLHLRQLGISFIKADSNTLQPVAFDKAADEIESLLPQLNNHGAEVLQISNAIAGYVQQLRTVHVQHLHLFPGQNAAAVATPHVNNGLGGAPYQTGTAVAAAQVDATKVDPVPQPAGKPTASTATDPAVAAKVEPVPAAAAVK
jgi:hypothetical protein